MPVSTTNQSTIAEAIVLEELFLDQLQFKLSAAMNLYTLKQDSNQEINSFISQLHDLTHKNITLLKKYDDRG